MKIDSNTVVFITGGQQGLGYASAKHLASKGASIFIVDLDKNKLDKLYLSSLEQTKLALKKKSS